MRVTLWIAASVMLSQISLIAEGQDRSLERLHAALQSQSVLSDHVRVELTERVPTIAPVTLGPLTFRTPTGRGEMVQASLPIGSLVTHGVKAVARSQRRRQETAARRRVAAELAALKERQNPQP